VKLSDIMSAAGLSYYAEVALVLFMGAFIGILLRLYWPGRGRAAYDRALADTARLPLDDGSPDSTASVATRGR
jgi:cbb3-type cytochrome oxidase subunit 3